jgi:hypothetical protein
VAICKKHGISEMECDCPQWSAEAQDILGKRQGGIEPSPFGKEQMAKSAKRVAANAARLGFDFPKSELK